MDAAIELIAEQGFERTSAAEIAERAGYSRSMVAARYGSKEALLEDLMRSDYQSRMLPDLDGVAGVDRLLQWVAKVRAETQTNPSLIAAFYTLLFEAAGPIPQLRPWADEWLARCVHLSAEALRIGQLERTVRPDVHPEVEAEQFVTSAVGLAFRYVISGNLQGWDHGLARWCAHFEELRA